MDQTLKSRKEEFVSNLSGGDISEINLVTLVAPVNTIWRVEYALSPLIT